MVPAWPFVLRGWLVAIGALIALTIVQLGWVVALLLDALDAAGWRPSVVRDGIDDGRGFAIYLAISGTMLVLWIVLAVLFVARSRRFPAAVTTVLLFWFVLLMLDVVVFGVRHVLVPVQFVALAVLVSYLRRSTRVRATFVR